MVTLLHCYCNPSITLFVKHLDWRASETSQQELRFKGGPAAHDVRHTDDYGAKFGQSVSDNMNALSSNQI